MTKKEWLAQASQRLVETGFSSGLLESRLLLSHVLDANITKLTAHQTESLSRQEAAAADKLLERRLGNEPIAYIVGYKDFYGLKIQTDARALIPRGESEIMVETAIEWLKKRPNSQQIVEIGTGSGAIILAIAKSAPSHNYLATDISRDAIDLAKLNASTLQLPVNFLIGDLAQPLRPKLLGKVDLLLANLPYIANGLLSALHPDIKYFEPNLALAGGHDGLAFYRRLFPQAKQLMADDGLILCEHDFDQSEAMRRMAHDHFPSASITTKQDFGHADRLTLIKLATTTSPK